MNRRLSLSRWLFPLTLFATLAIAAPNTDKMSKTTLPACLESPNCVSSQSHDESHQIAPITYQGSAKAALVQLQAVIQTMPRSLVVEASENTLRVEFRSRLIGFVDDFEARMSAENGVIEVRSASRTGHSDFGVNRRRVETIRTLFNAANPVK